MTLTGGVSARLPRVGDAVVLAARTSARGLGENENGEGCYKEGTIFLAPVS
jgi:hypothetical protein